MYLTIKPLKKSLKILMSLDNIKEL